MRYLPLTPEDRAAMLGAIGAGSIDDLFVDVPQTARRAGLVDLPRHMGEIEVERAFRAFADDNLGPGAAPFFLGAGAYRHHIPAAVDALIQRGEFLTSYTPYQPEVSQGTLQALFEFQTLVAMITGMEVANASMYDGASAAAEAVLMANRVTRRGRAVLSGGLHPHYRATIATYARYGDFTVEALPPDPGATADPAIDDATACVVVQYPGFFGHLRDLRPLAERAHAAGALLVVVVTEVAALGLVETPGAMGADIVVAEGQSIGVPLSFGGPYLGLFATRERFVRQMPGRLAGQTADAEGRPGYVLTLSTREQHIRREKATSNICTNSGLCALGFTVHLTLLGEAGFARLARLNHEAACRLADRLAALPGVAVVTDSFFNEFAVRLPRPAIGVVDALADAGILGGVPVARLYPGETALANLMLVAASELTTEDDVNRLTTALAGVLA
ncbi:MAG: aminomethyl-transferring glycine dehydrogenase subunit GcvPA [Alphaproteobacteria bacterium]